MEVHLKELFTRFQEQFSSGPSLGPTSGTCLLKVEGIPTAFIKSLFRASAALYRTEPWKRIRPCHLFGVRIGKEFDWPGKKQSFPCAQFIGGDGGDLGFHMFKSDLDAQKMSGLSETSVPTDVELLRVMFLPESLLLPSTKRMIRSLSLEAETGDKFPIIDVARRNSTGNRFRNPTAEELRYVFAFMKAITLLHPFLQFADNALSGKRRVMKFEPFIETVDVQWPPELPRAGELVAVTISHPPGQVYQEKKLVIRTELSSAEGGDDRDRRGKEFMKKFRLPAMVNVEGISAAYENSLLTVLIPRTIVAAVAAGRWRLRIDLASDEVEEVLRGAGAARAA